MKATQLIGHYAAALAVLAFCSRTHTVQSRPVQPQQVVDRVADTIEIELEQMTEKIEKVTKRFNERIERIFQKAKRGLEKVEFLKCEESLEYPDNDCLSTRTEQLLKVEAKLRDRIIEAKKVRKKRLRKLEKSVDRKKSEVHDVKAQVNKRSSTGSRLEREEKELEGLFSETKLTLQGMEMAVPIEADCDVTGGITTELTDSDWDSVVDTFQAIVNLAYVHIGEDHIFLASFEALPYDSADSSYDSAERRDLKRRRRRPGFWSSNNQSCGVCNPKTARDNRFFRIGEKRFDQFVNNYLAGVITGMFQYRTPAGAKPVEASCTFS
eukprot:scaffold23424_cov57-Attheya_sp.AAC.2